MRDQLQLPTPSDKYLLGLVSFMPNQELLILSTVLAV